MIEDFHKVVSEEKQPLAQSLKIFSDLASAYPFVKIIAVGATDTARQVVDYDPEMRRRVAEILVPLMTDTEIEKIMVNGADLMNVAVDRIIQPIAQYSVGLASVCHQLCLNACLEAQVVVKAPATIDLTDDHLRAAVSRYVRDQSDSLKAIFDWALRRHQVRKFDNCRLILGALADGPLEGMLHSEILHGIRAWQPSYPSGNLTNYLHQLMDSKRGAILSRDANQKYRFIDPLHHTFAQATPLDRSHEYTVDIIQRTAFDHFLTLFRTSDHVWFSGHGDLSALNVATAAVAGTWSGTLNPPSNMGTAGADTIGLTANPPLGIDDPCYCGSGRPYQNCHGAIATGTGPMVALAPSHSSPRNAKCGFCLRQATQCLNENRGPMMECNTPGCHGLACSTCYREYRRCPGWCGRQAPAR